MFLRLATAVLLLRMVRANHIQTTLWHAEWPSLAWLKEKYPARSNTEGADAYAFYWLAYMRASEWTNDRAVVCTAGYAPKELNTAKPLLILWAASENRRRRLVSFCFCLKTMSTNVGLI